MGGQRGGKGELEGGRVNLSGGNSQEKRVSNRFPWSADTTRWARRRDKREGRRRGSWLTSRTLGRRVASKAGGPEGLVIFPQCMRPADTPEELVFFLHCIPPSDRTPGLVSFLFCIPLADRPKGPVCLLRCIPPSERPGGLVSFLQCAARVAGPLGLVSFPHCRSQADQHRKVKKIKHSQKR